MRRRIADTLDPLAFVLLGAWVVLALTGGFDLRGLGIPLSAHGLEQLGLALVAVLVARRIVDPVTPLREVPLVERLGAWGEAKGFRAPWVIPAAAAAFAVLLALAAWARHATFRSNAYDLGLFENVVWNLANGRGFASDLLGHSFLGEHLSPILLPVALVYKLFPHTETLLILQTVALALGVFPLVRLARRELKNEGLAHTIGIAYLIYTPLRNVALFDFHPVAFATPLLIEAFASIREGRLRRAAVVAVLALGTKETAAVAVATLGVYAAVALGHRRFGAVLAVGAVAYLLAAIGWVIPGVRGEAYPFVERYAALTSGNILALFSLDRVWMLILLLGPVAFLPLASPTHLALLAPPLAMHLLSSDPHQRSILYQYTSTVTPMVFAGAVMGAKQLVERDDLRVILAYYPTKAQAQRYVIALFALGAVVFSHWSPVTEVRAGWGEHRTAAREIVGAVPADAAVSAQGNLLPHLARRDGIGLFPWAVSEWVALDRAGNPWPMKRRAELHARIEAVVAEPGCETVAARDALLLARCDVAAAERLVVTR